MVLVVTDRLSEFELRCPSDLPGRDGECHPGRLLARLRNSGEQESYVHPDNLIELSCDDCRSRLRKAGRQVSRVLHRFNFIGELAETLVVSEPDSGR
jgi:hypothetical protein